MSFKAPKQTLQTLYGAGKKRAGLTADALALQAFMAGIYIASASQLLISVGGGILGAAVFPFGLIAVVLTSAEMITGNVLIFVTAFLGGHVKITCILRNWSMAWLMNFAGSLVWAYFLGYLSGALDDIGGGAGAALVIKVAESKANLSNGAIFLKGIGANFFVCVGIWQATTAEDVAGKVLALWFSASAFVIMGLEHCVANMYLIPMGTYRSLCCRRSCTTEGVFISHPSSPLYKQA